MSEVVVRVFRDADRERVVRLWSDCGLVVPWNDPGRDIDRKMADSPELFFVVEDSHGNAAGTCMAGYEGHRGWIFYMAVRPDLQGRGLARALLGHAEAALAERGCPKVELMVRDTNTSVINFYEHLGYGVLDVKVLGKRLVNDE